MCQNQIIPLTRALNISIALLYEERGDGRSGPARAIRRGTLQGAQDLDFIFTRFCIILYLWMQNLVLRYCSFMSNNMFFFIDPPLCPSVRLLFAGGRRRRR